MWSISELSEFLFFPLLALIGLLPWLGLCKVAVKDHIHPGCAVVRVNGKLKNTSAQSTNVWRTHEILQKFGWVHDHQSSEVFLWALGTSEGIWIRPGKILISSVFDLEFISPPGFAKDLGTGKCSRLQRLNISTDWPELTAVNKQCKKSQSAFTVFCAFCLVRMFVS